MDGWGLGKVKSSDAIQSHAHHLSVLFIKYPNSTLITCGEEWVYLMGKWVTVKLSILIWVPEELFTRNYKDKCGDRSGEFQQTLFY
jgi:hypothetical protein